MQTIQPEMSKLNQSNKHQVDSDETQPEKGVDLNHYNAQSDEDLNTRLVTKNIFICFDLIDTLFGRLRGQ